MEVICFSVSTFVAAIEPILNNSPAVFTFSSAAALFVLLVDGAEGGLLGGLHLTLEQLELLLTCRRV